MAGRYEGIAISMPAPARTDANYPIERQKKSPLPPGSFWPTVAEPVPLYEHYWPPVPAFRDLSPELSDFISQPAESQKSILASLRTDNDAYDRFLHTSLATIYADWFGYRDSPFDRGPDDEKEIAHFRAKIQLERELFDYWIDRELPRPQFGDQLAAADYLDELAESNPGVNHPLFAYLREHASRQELELFLQWEVIRNEVVDDEVALLTVGLQGMQKAVAAANLWDECGRGKIEHFHTYWLRRLLRATDGWDRIYGNREQHPWFAKITSNMFAALLTRPCRKYLAYGYFLITESWVESHFRAILAGLARVGLTSDDIRIYFAAHVAIDPRHSRELSDGLRMQRPRLDGSSLQDVVYGAHLASLAGTRQFDQVLQYLRSSERKN